jgi:glycosidase
VNTLLYGIIPVKGKCKRMIDIIEKLYGEVNAAVIHSRIEQFIKRYSKKSISTRNRYIFTEKDAVLIIYPDHIHDLNTPGFEVIRRFLLSHVHHHINTVHLLPFFPFSSDDGFSIIDYYRADDTYGGWLGFKKLGKHYRLMVDAVLNHISSKSTWFEEFLKGNPPYSSYFITSHPSADLREVMRPRSSPLLTHFITASGEKWLWTTFGTDQIDLNYKNPEVFLAIVEVLLFYISQGAALIRLDAIAYIWKETGTSCIHLPEVHLIVKLVRKIFDRVAPHVVLITETNVPHRENISYLGNGSDEAQMVYQFPLPPLIVHALLKENSRYLTEWVEGLRAPDRDATFFNFTASHDGIGVRPLTGLVPEEDIDELVILTQQRGGGVSYKEDRDGHQSPYELNINYLSLLTAPGEPPHLSVRRFLLSQSIMLSMPGVPGIYFHSLIGSVNDNKGVEKTGKLRSINREKLSYKKLTRELRNDMRRKTVFSFYKKMLAIRKKEEAFNPYAPFRVLPCPGKVFALERMREKESSIIAIHNMSGAVQTCRICPVSAKKRVLRDLFSHRVYYPDRSGYYTITLGPNEFFWLKG